MQRIPFIFSEKWTYKLSRHLAFWLVASLGLGLIGLGIRPLFGVQISPGAFKEHVLQPLLYLPGQVFLVYTLLYWIIPRYLLRSKYRQAAVWAITLAILGGFIAASSNVFLHDRFYNWIEVPYKKGMIKLPINPQNSPLQTLPYEFLFALRATLNTAAFAAALKLAKYWYEKEYLNSILQREKLDAELQSLKAQIHPHFLFNTLNNIYSVTETVSPLATGMLLKLSAILRYILYECNRPLVPLTQEFTLILDYIHLEKVRYTGLDLNTTFPSEPKGYTIAPLLLLPLVENCFKHGTSRVLDQPWVRIDAELKDDWLLVKLINGKLASKEEDTFTEGIGLKNVRKRLDLLYPGRHELNIISEHDLFIVNLKIKLTDTKKADG